MRSRRLAVVAGFMLLSSLLAHGTPPAGPGRPLSLERMDPRIAGWEFLGDFHFEDRVIRALDPDGLVFRKYRRQGAPVLDLVLVCHRNNRWGAHDPRICFTSQGWTILAETTREIPAGPQNACLNRLVVGREGRRLLVYYFWFNSRGRIGCSRERQMVRSVADRLFHGDAISGFARLSIPLDPSAHTEAAMEAFAARFVPVLAGFAASGKDRAGEMFW